MSDLLLWCLDLMGVTDVKKAWLDWEPWFDNPGKSLLILFELLNSEAKNFLDLAELDSPSLSPLRIEIIFCCLIFTSSFEKSWVFLSFGSKMAKLPLVVTFACSLTLSISLSLRAAPLRMISLFCLFSSIVTRNSVCSSLKRIWTLSNSLEKPSHCA